MNWLFRKLVDNRAPDSVANQCRLKRIQFFKSLLASIAQPVKILDVGGTEDFWEKMGFAGSKDVHITLLNLEKAEVHFSNLSAVSGDARRMPQYQDRSFDIVFSNSVIEHVGDDEDKAAMAREVRRIGIRYFIQTPNKYFPIEPHFFFPLFQFFPLALKIWLIRHFNLGWHTKECDYSRAKTVALSARLLTRRDLERFFPGAKCYEEKIFGWTKSFVVYGGF